MTDLRAGATHLILPTLGKPEERKGEFLDAVRRAAAGEFEILGELGRRADGGIAYLARDLAQARLVALRFELTPGSHHDYVLEVLRELDSSLPASGLGCPGCGDPLRGWGRYCPGCGYDLSGASGPNPRRAGPDPLRSVRELVGAGYHVLGQMKRAEGGGMIYFARERGRDTIVGFRLKQEAGKRLAVDRTAVIPSLADDPVEVTSSGGEPEPPRVSLPSMPRPEAKPSRVRKPNRFSWTWIALIVAGILVVGLVFGALLS